jgi:hypothetical protein
LRQSVTSPKGTTYEALAVLMADDGLKPLLAKAVAAATRRSRELARRHKRQAFYNTMHVRTAAQAGCPSFAAQGTVAAGCSVYCLIARDEPAV